MGYRSELEWLRAQVEQLRAQLEHQRALCDTLEDLNVGLRSRIDDIYSQQLRLMNGSQNAR